MAADGHTQSNPLKPFELLGKTIANRVLDDLYKSDLVKLKKVEEELYSTAKREKKAQMLVRSLTRHFGQILSKSLFDEKDEEKDFNDVMSLSSASLEVQENATDTFKLCSHVDCQRQRIKFARQIYPVIASTRLALIICNTDFTWLSKRKGAEHDITGMKLLLEALGYSVVVEKNLKASDMERVLEEFASRLEHETSDSTFLVLMSHGMSRGICGTDYKEELPQILVFSRIFQIFNTSNCPSLKNKPKVIIVQACRGNNDGAVWDFDSAEFSGDSCTQNLQNLPIFEDDSVQKAHVEKDFIAFYSSTPDNKSWRNENAGSLFIMQLIKNFREHASCCHLYDIFIKVQHSFEMPMEKIQMPTIGRTTLTKYFYLFPEY